MTGNLRFFSISPFFFGFLNFKKPDIYRYTDKPPQPKSVHSSWVGKSRSLHWLVYYITVRILKATTFIIIWAKARQRQCTNWFSDKHDVQQYCLQYLWELKFLGYCIWSICQVCLVMSSLVAKIFFHIMTLSNPLPSRNLWQF